MALPNDRSRVTFSFMAEVKKRRKGTTRVSSQRQVTIPTEAFRSAGFAGGERLTARSDGPGRVTFKRADDVLAQFAGALTGVYEPDELDKLRDEWD